MPVPAVRHLPLLALGIAALFAGLWAGIGRLGLDPAAASPLTALHGPLMVSGFFGTLIGLERAVALGGLWPYAGPAASGLGALLLLLGAPLASGAGLMLFGSLVFVGASAVIVRREPALFTLVLALGAACWAAGNLLLSLGVPVAGLVPWWMLFLVLTVAAERLELTRFLRFSPRRRALFLAALAALLAGAALSAAAPHPGAVLSGLALIGLALWLAAFDVARRTVRQRGLPRYAALCLLSGYGWLAAGGALLALLSWDGAYGATLHALFVGFAFAMVFGHAPIILPALLRIPVPFRPRLYAPLLLLHASLALRVAGQLGGWPWAWQWGGLGNAAAILLFFALIAAAALAELRGPAGSVAAPGDGRR